MMHDVVHVTLCSLSFEVIDEMYCSNVTGSNTVIVGNKSREMYTRTSLDLSTIKWMQDPD